MNNYLDLRNVKEYGKLEKPAQIIKNGGIVVFPTETVYGIGTNGLDKNAVKKLYDVKKRGLDKPISLLVSDMNMIKKLAKDITDIEYKIMKAFFPGPLTIILNKKEIIPDIVTANGKTVGIKMPEGEIARKLIEYSEIPIATPSANISGKKSGTNIDQIKKDFGKKVDYYIDGGESKLGIGSTIVKVVNGKPVILRQGSITIEQINEVIN